MAAPDAKTYRSSGPRLHRFSRGTTSSSTERCVRNVRGVLNSLVRYGLIAVPALMLVAAVPFVNRAEPRIVGLPFLFVWLMFWVLVAPLFLAAAERLRNSR